MLKYIKKVSEEEQKFILATKYKYKNNYHYNLHKYREDKRDDNEN